MKFIPYDQFENIESIGKERFYKATWRNGPPYWNEDFEYKDSIIVTK